MKTPRTLLAAFLAVSVLTVSAFAADPSGTWKWTSVNKANGPSEVTALLVLKNGVLTGTVTNRNGPAEITHATYKDGVVAFTVTRSPGTAGEVVFKYSGTVGDDAITGTLEKTGPGDTPPVTADWKPTRVK